MNSPVGWSTRTKIAEAAPTDRAYWEQTGTKTTVQLADELLTIAREIDSSLELKYNKFYIGLSKAGQAFNFVYMRPRKIVINFIIRLPRSDEIDAKIEKAHIETLEYSTRSGAYRLSLHKENIAKNRELLKELMEAAYKTVRARGSASAYPLSTFTLLGGSKTTVTRRIPTINHIRRDSSLEIGKFGPRVQTNVRSSRSTVAAGF
jgi:hypothetical protein